ncbi:hypothetical protein [Roseibium aggregatum]|uniref:Glycosyl transferase family 28 C-terminal domain-containing protein n=1 Tax=Roseibium aggregatum TaxID=187304 RepID=A0A0M6YDK3_9HYPH|nr:hypothetical protein [Roseibium aggregatum]CTQ47583.1 hypothetical protein LAL4801_06045 [Roseibium aggregatum]
MRHQEPSALFISANGTGRGHLVRQIAVASKLRYLRPVFVTMSYAAKLVEEFGFPLIYFPHHDLTNENSDKWNRNLTNELESVIKNFNVKSIVYDVNFVFDGIIDILRSREYLNSIWIRRAMWPDAHSSYLGARVHFDTIIEPMELAGSEDFGPTKTDIENVKIVPPILWLDPKERLDRASARKKLGIPERKTVFALDFHGSGNDEYEAARKKVISLLVSNDDCFLIEFCRSSNFSHFDLSEDRYLKVELNDAFRYSNAWDGAVWRAGYNGFHENLMGCIPTVFIPNNTPSLDLQTTRATWAAKHEYAAHLPLEANDRLIEAAISNLLDASWRWKIRENNTQLTQSFSGAQGSLAAAEIVEGYTV